MELEFFDQTRQEISANHLPQVILDFKTRLESYESDWQTLVSTQKEFLDDEHRF